MEDYEFTWKKSITFDMSVDTTDHENYGPHWTDMDIAKNCLAGSFENGNELDVDDLTAYAKDNIRKAAFEKWMETYQPSLESAA